jgi:hypothetical protein
MTSRAIVFCIGVGGMWAILGLPGLEFVATAWVVLLLWATLLAMAVFPAETAREMGVDVDVYGGLVPILGFALPLGAAAVGSLLLIAGRYGPEPVRELALGLPGALLLGFAAAGCTAVFMLLKRQTLGDRGRVPIEDPRGTMMSSVPPPRSEADLARPRTPPPPPGRSG